MEFSSWIDVKKAQHEGALHRHWGPHVVEFEVTNRCNLRCAMCDRWRWPKKTIESQRARANCLGNVSEKPFGEIWSGGRYNAFRKPHNPVNILREKNVCGQREHYFVSAKIEQAIAVAEKAERALSQIPYDDGSYLGSNIFETGV